MPTEEEIKRIIELYDNGNGLSQGQIARELNRSKSTIHEWLKGLGLIDSNGSGERSETKRATEVKAKFDRERRIALNDLWFEKIESMLISAKDPNTLRVLAIPYGVAEDKRTKLDPDNPSGKDTGLEEMREAIHKARHPDDMEASSS